ncbi:MAG: chromate transporter, partial [Bacillota bacterium]|nr:chromate transporter [Bacillota bacterium]
IEREVVENNKWMESKEFRDSLAVCQSVPGAIAVNNAVFIGYRINGIVGALSAGLGVILPSFFIIMAIASVFAQIKNISMIDSIFNGVRAAVVALILTAGLRLLSVTVFNLLIIVLTFISIAIFEINPIFIIFGAVTLGILKNRNEDK